MLGLGAKGLKPEVLGEAILTALTTLRPKVRYTVTPDAVESLVTGLMPKRMMDGLIGGRLGLTPPKV
jgi:hypothetical protein